MELRYYIIDEISLDFCRDCFGKIFFTDKIEAEQNALNYCDAWQIIEIPFHNN